MGEKYVSANPSIVFREDFDDVTVLFDPDSGRAFNLNRTGALIWKLLDGKHAVSDIVAHVQGVCNDTSHSVEQEALDFINHLIKNGLAGYVV